MGFLFLIFVIVSTATIVQKSLRSFFLHPRHYRKSKTFISLEDWIALSVVYSILILGFGCVYFSLMVYGTTVLTESGVPVHGSYEEVAESAAYFSAVTLLSVGYGDITPVGLGRWISIIEALVGYLLPAAFVLSTVVDSDR